MTTGGLEAATQMREREPTVPPPDTLPAATLPTYQGLIQLDCIGKGKCIYTVLFFVVLGYLTLKVLHGSHSFTCNYTNACLYFISVHQMGPPPKLRLWASNWSLILTYLPRKDERLSRPGWLTYSGRYTHISGRPSAAGRAQDRKVRRSRTDILPLCHATNHTRGPGSSMLWISNEIIIVSRNYCR